MQRGLFLLFLAFLKATIALKFTDLSLFLFSSSSSDGGDDDKDGDGDEFDDEEYELEIKLTNDYLSIKSETNSYEIDYELFTKYNGDDYLVISVEYEASSDLVPETKTEVRFDYIQEWHDDNGDGYLQDSEKVGDAYVIGTYGFDAITGNTFSADGLYTFQTKESSPGYFSVTTYFTSNATSTLSPNSVKFDVEISGWPYQSPDNQIALLFEVRADTECEYDEKDGEGEIGEVDTGEPISSLTWVTDYKHDNIPGAVLSEIIDDVTELEALGIDVDPGEEGSVIAVWYTFKDSAGADLISWDPTLGVYSSSGSKSNGSSDDALSGGAVAGIVIGVLVGMALIAGVAWFVVSKASPKSSGAETSLI